MKQKSDVPVSFAGGKGTDAQIDYRSFSKTVFDQEMFVGCFTMKQKMCVDYNDVLS